MYYGHPSSFAPTINLLISIQNPSNREKVAELRPRIEQVLAERFREETDGPLDGPLRIDYARRRIEGAVEQLNQYRRRAVHASACTEFLELVDSVLAVATKALELAPATPARVTGPDDSPSPAAWATTEIEKKWTPELPDFLKDI